VLSDNQEEGGEESNSDEGGGRLEESSSQFSVNPILGGEGREVRKKGDIGKGL